MVLKEQCIIKFNQANKNGRVYSSDCFNLEDPIIQEKLQTGTFFGELGLPQENRSEVDLTKASHKVISLYKKEDGLYADIEILDTPSGRILEETVKNSLGAFRTRGAGTLISRDDGNCDVTDYTLYTIDYTDNPA